MNAMKWPARLGFGLAAGAAIAFVDNAAFGGEVSSIVIVVMLLAATTATAALWGSHGWIAATATWMCLPLAHLVKHVAGLPDTLHPSAYASILLHAAFTFVIAAFGTGIGMLIHWTAAGTPSRKPRAS